MKSVVAGLALLGTAIAANRRRSGSGLSDLGSDNQSHVDDVKRSLMKFNALILQAQSSQNQNCEARFNLINQAGEELRRTTTHYESVAPSQSRVFIAKFGPEISSAERRYDALKERFIASCLSGR